MIATATILRITDIPESSLKYTFSTGIDEDPVTGSSFSVLTPYWASLLEGGSKRVMRARQCSKRGGEVALRIQAGRVTIIGEAAIVSAGYIGV